MNKKNYRYEVTYSDGSKVSNTYLLLEQDAFKVMAQEIMAHFMYGDKNVSVVNAVVYYDNSAK